MSEFYKRVTKFTWLVLNNLGNFKKMDSYYTQQLTKLD